MEQNKTARNIYVSGNLIHNRASIVVSVDFSINGIGIIDYSLLGKWNLTPTLYHPSVKISSRSRDLNVKGETIKF